MQVVVTIPGEDEDGRNFLTWTPVLAAAHIDDVPAGAGNTAVRLRNSPGGGQLVFDSAKSDAGQDTIDLQLPNDGTAVDFWIAGKFGAPSENLNDAVIEAHGTAGFLPWQRAPDVS